MLVSFHVCDVEQPVDHNVIVPSPESSSAQGPVLYRHSTVRHSSLLRFGQTITPESPDGASTTKVDRFPLPKSPKSHVVTYRPRSQTYTGVESEADDEAEPGTPPFQYPVDELANLSIGCPPTPYIQPMSEVCIPLRAEAREFAPLALPPPMGSITSQTSSQTEYRAEIARIIPTLVTRGPPITPLRRSSLANEVIPSSSQVSSPSSSPVSLPAPLPATPSLVRPHPRTHTEPRTHHGYGNLSRLSIYNDHVSPTQQPQTPTDLVRRPILTDRDTMYTALPGSVGRSQRAISNEGPTRRRELRARWSREYERAEAVERERVNRQRAERTFWFDEWAADRVGEENS
jgi:hypothetical protein